MIVTVIIPTFDRAKLVKRAIASILTQTYTDFELIIIDDGSRDETKEAVSSFNDKRITYIFQENSGVSAARNAGIKKARSGLISFLDSDDEWHPLKLEKQITFMRENPQLFISQTDEIWIRHGRRVNPMKKHTKYAGMIYERCLKLCLVTPSSAMMRRELFDEVGLFDESLPACEDYDLWLRIAHKYPVGLIKEKLITKYGGHDTQLSKKFTGIDRFRIQAMLKILKSNVLTPDKAKATEKELKKKCAIYGNGCMKHGNTEEGKKYLKIE